MGLLRDLIDTARSIIAGPPTTARQAAPVTPARKPRLTVDGLSRQLHAEFPGGIDAETLWARCDTAGLEMADVDRKMDELAYAATRAVEVTVQRIDTASLAVVDLTGVDAVRMRIKGTAMCLLDDERARYGGTEYLLVREPENDFDPHAVAVYGRGRRVGYVSASRAAALAPLLDALEGDAFKVGGAAPQQNSVRLWVDVPSVPALRTHVRGR